MTTSNVTRAPNIAAVTAAGAGLVLVAALLYVTELSRAAALVVLAFALVLVGAAVVARERGSWPSRPWLVVFASLVAAALAIGLWLYVDGQLHPPVAV
ncbi:MAG: hypothetical protein ABIQ53_11660 [Terracoccus sp.]